MMEKTEISPERLRSFLGGQIEVVCENTGSTYRGHIATIRITGTVDVNLKLTVGLKWFAKQQPDFTWVAERYSQYTAGLMVYYTLIDMGPGRRLFLASPAMSELIVLYPPGDNTLDPALVRQLASVS